MFGESNVRGRSEEVKRLRHGDRRFPVALKASRLSNERNEMKN